MNKIAVGFLVGSICALVGVLVALNASALATHWETIGPNAWDGTTDPETRLLYRLLGMVTAVFGLVLIALSFQRWLREIDRPAPR